MRHCRAAPTPLTTVIGLSWRVVGIKALLQPVTQKYGAVGCCKGDKGVPTPPLPRSWSLPLEFLIRSR